MTLYSSPDTVTLVDPAFALFEGCLFWQPRLTGATGVSHHLPFIFWLMQTLRPSTVLGLGLRNAEGYFALCQAIDTLALPAMAWGFGDWTAEAERTSPQDSDAPVHHLQHYTAFSRLTALSDPMAALARFEAGMFDLLLIEAETVQGDPDALVAALLHHASQSGVVLVQGGVVEGAPGPLVTALSAARPAFVLPDHDGCTLVLAGAHGHHSLRRLIDLKPGSEARDAVQNGFMRLGTGLAAATADLAVPPHPPKINDGSQDVAEDEHAATEARIADLKAALATAMAQVQATRQEGQDLNLRQIRVLTAELERLTEDLAQARADSAEVARHLARQTVTQTQYDSVAAELAALRIRHFSETEDLRAEITWLERALAAEKETAAAETQALVKAEAETRTKGDTALAEAVEDAAQRVEILTDAYRAERAGLHADLAALRARVAQLTSDLAARDARLVEQSASHKSAQEHLAQEMDTALAEKQAALDAARQAGAALAQQLAALHQSTAARDRLRLVHLRLRAWQVQWLCTKPRLGRRPGPSGGRFAAELACVARHPLFDAAWYRTAHPDLHDSALPSAEHFLRHGLFEGRDPSPRFRTLEWFSAHPDALEGGRNPLLDPDLPAMNPA